MDYSHYLVDDFIFDESFQAFTADADSEAGRQWQAWLQQHPHKQAEAAQAQALLRSLAQARPLALPAGLLPQELARLRQALRPAPAAPPRLRSQRRVWRLVGALAVLLAALGLGWWRWAPGAAAPARVRYATAPGQRRTFTLPDGSVVALNANSSLTTAAAWPAGAPREVWLTGEGYFRVRHLASQPVADIDAAPANVKFVVHAGELRVSVLGTQFDVSNRAGSTRVVLAEGRVAVARPAHLGPGSDHLVMQPGDLVETSAARPVLARRRVEPALYAGWTQGRLRFHQTPVREVVQFLQDSYGLRVVFADSAMLRQTIVGEVPTASPEVLLAALGKVLNADMVRTGNAVRFLPARR